MSSKVNALNEKIDQLITCESLESNPYTTPCHLYFGKHLNTSSSYYEQHWEHPQNIPTTFSLPQEQWYEYPSSSWYEHLQGKKFSNKDTFSKFMGSNTKFGTQFSDINTCLDNMNTQSRGQFNELSTNKRDIQASFHRLESQVGELIREITEEQQVITINLDLLLQHVEENWSVTQL